MDALAVPVDAREVVPHAGRMVLLRNVVSHDAQETVCDVAVTRESLFCEAEGVPAWVGLEYMAQSVGAHDGMSSREGGGRPGVGFLLGSRRLDLRTARFVPGQTLRVSVRHLWGEGELFVFAGEVRDAATGAVLVAGQLNLFRPAEIGRFLEERDL
ncbi:MAG: hypothetical protein A2X36_01170 [Elusimicrobia bacterium GWA2_69_24]|nr:MAG: hypothetical protein A2X36_01170 [Elusimicrobia bacterium GWA2_69_24]HBL16477.1 hypothetical protein [Elusimicrobiota bacterium]